MSIQQNVLHRTPSALRELPRWIVHRGKKPWDVTTNRPLSGWQKPEAWLPFFDAVALVESGQADGVGFVFAGNDTTFVGLDLDKCITRDEGEAVMNACATGLMELFPGAFWEYSPSGTGLHCILKADATAWEGITHLKAAGFKGCKNVEVFANSGYLTFTGDTWQEGVTFEDYSDELRELIATLKAHKRPNAPSEARAANVRTIHPVPPANGGGRHGGGLRDALTPDDVRACLDVIPAADYDVWVKVGAALKHELGDVGFTLWDNWSAKAANYGGVSEQKWRSLPNGATYGSLIALARTYQPDFLTPGAQARKGAAHSNGNGNGNGRPPSVLAKYGAYTARELAVKEFPPVTWLVEGMIPAGLTFLAGRPKVGKSWFALQLAHAHATGGQVLGMKAAKGRVLYLATEDSPRRMKERQRMQVIPHTDGITYVHRFPTLTPDGIEELKTAIKEGHFTLIILDTLNRLLPPEAKQNESENMTQILGPLQSMAQELDVSIVLVDHHRKRGAMNRDVVEDIMGSVSKVGVADTIMGLYKGDDGFELIATGRDIEGATWPVRFDKGITWAWQLTEAAPGVRIGSRRHKVLKAIRELSGQGENATVTRVADFTGISKDNVSREVKELVSIGEVHTTRGEKRNEKYLILPIQV